LFGLGLARLQRRAADPKACRDLFVCQPPRCEFGDLL
jgi:hypothetical protein